MKLNIEINDDSELAHLSEKQIEIEIDAILLSMGKQDDYVMKKYISVLIGRRNAAAYGYKTSKRKEDKKKYKEQYDAAKKEIKTAILAGK